MAVTADEYINRLLAYYAGTFDIYQPYSIGDKEYSAYGYFFSRTEKYVLSRDAKLWTSDGCEHILFDVCDDFHTEDLEETKNLITEYMEPVLVRKNEKLPPKDHMYSYMSVVKLVKEPLDKQTIHKVKTYAFDKGYRFNLRGFSQGRIIIVSLADQKVYVSRYASKSAKLYQDVFKEAVEGKIGFQEMLEREGTEAFSQQSK